MKARIWIPIAVVLALGIIAGVTWAIRSREAPEVKELRELASKMTDRENTTDEQRRELGQRMREIGENLPEEQRREVFREMGNQFRERMMQRVREFAELPEEERNAFLDRDIDRFEEMRRGWEQRRRDRGDGGDRAGREGRGGAGGPGGRGGPGGPGGAGGRGDRPRTEEDREARRRSRLDNSSAEDRAYMMEYFKAINERREERGMEPLRRGWGRGGR